MKTVLDTLKPLLSDDRPAGRDQALNQVASSQGAGVALVLGSWSALWSASGYVGAFGRAMNKIYEIEEGRPFWKLRPIMLLLTLIAVVLAAIALLLLIVSGPAGAVDRQHDRARRHRAHRLEDREVADPGR